MMCDVTCDVSCDVTCDTICDIWMLRLILRELLGVLRDRPPATTATVP